MKLHRNKSMELTEQTQIVVSTAIVVPNHVIEWQHW